MNTRTPRPAAPPPVALLGLSLACLMVFSSGCATLSSVERGDDPNFATVMPPMPIPPEHNNGAIFQPTAVQGLFADYKARQVGDVLTVLLAERTQASKSASTSTSKEANVNMANPTILGRPVTRDGRPLLNTEISGSRDFDGQGSASQSNQLDGSITVMVSEVLPNGNLVVQGEKWLKINQGEEYIRLRGIVRPVDIRTDNTILSTQVASAQVAYGGRGALADSNRQGWLSRFFNSPVWPF
ncbi:flagellar basal body L-ring protein [Ectothiorhodospira shaposhnikovii]|uniref:flagellar basal body L-ring protein FlgH n=1 Tax=Ectothiorhodospira shaposhnikovii TaxID=1054 RepID=UPI001903C3B3|nr:flagellar basal body L-ring protein FlgH [Ectothiorhodospira shaposhnikovii]MBK1673448.1 flagellar basal body L-ring protein [Ectothiorhodospira shaposhnikovii]